MKKFFLMLREYLHLSTILLSISLIGITNNISAQTVLTETPFVGGQVFIEPGQTKEEIRTWFKILKDHDMNVCRIRMFETYMKDTQGNWDFSLFDIAFDEAKKNDIRVFATIFPETAFDDLGGFKFPGSKEKLDEVSAFIKAVVSHYKDHPALDTWVLINEPGGGELEENTFALEKYEDFKKSLDRTGFDERTGYQYLDLSWYEFYRYSNTWYLTWLKDQVHEYHPESHVHVNPHGIFENLPEYDLQEWEPILGSLGASAHASWHLGIFNREEYTHGISGIGEIVRGGAGNLPWMMTELQGGNNTFSGYDAMCPTKEEIEQWLWSSFAGGARGAIFWTLNPRTSGVEAGEWSMLNFQNKPSDRLIAASQVAKAVKDNPTYFEKSVVVESGVNLLYTSPSFYIEQKLQSPKPGDFEGRLEGASIKSIMAFYKAFNDLGIQSNIKDIRGFDFTKKNYIGETIVLANQVSLDPEYKKDLESFVSKGGKLIVTGLTGYYDKRAICLLNTSTPFENLLGGNIAEYKVVGNTFEIPLLDTHAALNAHLWKGSIEVKNAKPVIVAENEILGTKNKFGKGEVYWVPSCIGLGARVSEDNTSLVEFLKKVTLPQKNEEIIAFATTTPNVLLKTLKTEGTYLTVLINKGQKTQSVQLTGLNDFTGVSLYGESLGKKVNGKTAFTIKPEETIVIGWESATTASLVN
ncbi:beta-galactosidase trimerization domain-containing protein [Flammeovirga agarivorans]|uniref:beta-galactosidase n=1 Tax=Flammeovirga agarivorans TaxID=2726742 RepID=A0A7X8XY81_9BACT|nr:beta-galactosidase trimerization domain-containing protein [Flammeovirga agarivorans]NLR93962.1 hypothetical protein [Flammeovirga agarivorans]